MKKYSYHGYGKAKQLIFQVSGATGIVVFTMIGFTFFIAALQNPTVQKEINLINDPRVPPVCFGLVFILVAWAFGLMYINLLPTVWLDENGISISSFILIRKFIPWDEIIGIETIRQPLGYFFVKAKRISIFHRLIGWTYFRTYLPGFLIGKEIDGKEELIQAIQQRIKL